MSRLLDKDSIFVKKVNDVPLSLAHHDLHLANVLIDPQTATITGILDWEFALVGPCPLWNRPARPFLWNGKESHEALLEKRRLFAYWENRLRKTEEGRQILEDMQWRHDEQEQTFKIQNFLRCILEVCPRGGDENGKAKKGRQWWLEVEKAMQACDVD